jgi:hypothetical protein
MMTASPMDEPLVPKEIFSKIIKELMTPNPDDEDLRTQLSAISKLQSFEIDRIKAQMDNFREMEQDLAIRNLSISPFACIYFGHCYNLFDDEENSKTYVWKAIRQFKTKINGYDLELNDYNLALSYWYFGFLLSNSYSSDNNESCYEYLDKGFALLLHIQKTYKEKGNSDYYYGTKKLNEHLQSWREKFIPQKTFPPALAENRKPPIAAIIGQSLYNKISDAINAAVSPENSNPYQSDRRTESSNPLTQRSLIVDMSTLIPTSSQAGISSPEASTNEPLQTPETVPPQSDQKSSRHHITIPVDINALLHPNSDTTPLPWDLYQDLHSYGSQIPPEQQLNTNVSEKTETTTDALIYVIPVIPGRIPVYGQVTAGPSGAPVWGVHALSDPVDDTLTICFDGIKKKVYFINGSPIKFSESKGYGWLKVEGDSMNGAITAIRKSIEDKDHLLFCENHDMEYCAGKIVVAEIQEDVDPTPRLVVKRLVKLSGAVPDRSDGFEPEIVKYILRSESSLENDPKTGKSYKKDIDIVRDGQIRGYVVAIAKPTT